MELKRQVVTIGYMLKWGNRLASVWEPKIIIDKYIVAFTLTKCVNIFIRGRKKRKKEICICGCFLQFKASKVEKWSSSVCF